MEDRGQTRRVKERRVRRNTHTKKQISSSLLFYVIVLIRVNVSINKGL